MCTNVLYSIVKDCYFARVDRVGTIILGMSLRSSPVVEINDTAQPRTTCLIYFHYQGKLLEPARTSRQSKIQEIFSEHLTY